MTDLVQKNFKWEGHPSIRYCWNCYLVVGDKLEYVGCMRCLKGGKYQVLGPYNHILKTYPVGIGTTDMAKGFLEGYMSVATK